MKSQSASGKIRLHDKEFRVFRNAEEIRVAVSKIAGRINSELQGQNPIFLAVLNGSFLFAADLMKQVTIESSINFIRVSSYSGLRSRGEVKTVFGIENVKDRVVVILEDIVDTGNTLDAIMKMLDKENTKDVKVATLLFKPGAYKKARKIDYVGMEVPDEFLVGYGLDYNEAGRNLSDIYILEPEK